MSERGAPCAATVINAPGEIVLKEVADPQIQFPGDAVVRIVAACVCGSDLWRYRGIEGFEPGSRIGHEAVGVVESVGDAVSQVAPGDVGVRGGLAAVRDHVKALLPMVMDGSIRPGEVFDMQVSLDEVAEAYKAMIESEAVEEVVCCVQWCGELEGRASSTNRST